MGRKGRVYRREETGLAIVRGNFKLGDDTLAINPGPSSLCPADAAGLCKITQFCPEALCYSKRDEILYPKVLAFRMKQMEYWQTHRDHPKDVIKDFDYILGKMRVQTNWLRMCVASELYTSQDWALTDVLAWHLRKKWDIDTYGYCSVPTHPYRNLNWVVRGSGHGKSPCGDTIVIPHGMDVPEGYVLCPLDCGSCLFCKEPTYRRIAFRVHAKRKKV